MAPSKEFTLSCFQEFILPLIQEDYICFYTDGSKFEQDNCTGAGILTFATTGAYASSSSLNLHGRSLGPAYHAENYMWQKHSQSDYLYELEECLGIPFIISPGYWLLLDLCHQKSILLSIMNGHLHQTWIPSHRDIEGNERVDEFVKIGVKQVTELI